MSTFLVLFVLCQRSDCKILFLQRNEGLCHYKCATDKSTEDLDELFGFRLMYVLSGQMGMSQKPSGVAGTHRTEK